MKKIRQSGFVLLLVIMIVAVIGIEMFVLAGGSNTMLYQADAAYLEAVQQNLIASGLSWAEHKVKSENQQAAGKTVELDISSMKVRDGTLSVTILAPEGKEPQVQVGTSCSRARQTLRHTGKYKFK
jgi:hypothetical protein